MDTVLVANNNGYKVNRDLALFMAIQGKTLKEIADKFGVSHQAISKYIAPVRDKIEQMKAFHEMPDMAWEQHEYNLLSSVAPDDIKKMAAPQKYIAAGIARTKIGEIRGTTASNKPVIAVNISFNGKSVSSVDSITSGSDTIDIT
jgi:predicted DNA-binding protein YlxM (UPF0122 family)